MAENDQEYDEIYEEYRGAGFQFYYSKKHLSRSKDVPRETVLKLDKDSPGKRNKDSCPLYVKCMDCSQYMDFVEGPYGYPTGHWECPVCKHKIRERTIYSQLDRENFLFIESYINDDEPDDEEMNYKYD